MKILNNESIKLEVIEQSSIRLDIFLNEAIEDKSRSFFQKLIESGEVKVNGIVETSKKRSLSKGDKIEVNIPEATEVDIVAENIPLDIVYEDDDILVVNKPVGMVVHPAVSNYTGTLVNGIMHHCKDSLSGINGKLRPGIVHRIDKDTSGLLMIAKNDFAHNFLAAQLKEHTVTRGYKAIVENGFKDDSGTINKPIGRDKKNRLRNAVDYDNGKQAITNWKVIERLGDHTLVECRLETGRTHQIRVHMASINHQLLGDVLYGGHERFGAKGGQMLCAYLLGFIHPRTREYMEFHVDLPDSFENVLDKLRNRIK